MSRFSIRPSHDILHINMDYDLQMNSGLLKQFSLFPEYDDCPPFSYDTTNVELGNLIAVYNLKSVAGNGSQFSQILNLMKWLRESVTYDGSTSTQPTYNSRELLAYALKSRDNGINCRMLATILSEVLLSFGMKSRLVSLHSVSPYDGDNHVVTLVWLEESAKWIFVDPSFRAFFTDGDGAFMSPWELRQAYANRVDVDCTIEASFGSEPDESEARYRRYLSKNLFRMHSPVINTFGSETLGDQRWIGLAPIGFDQKRCDLLNLEWRKSMLMESGLWSEDFEQLCSERKSNVLNGRFVYSHSLRSFSKAPVSR